MRGFHPSMPPTGSLPVSLVPYLITQFPVALHIYNVSPDLHTVGGGDTFGSKCSINEDVDYLYFADIFKLLVFDKYKLIS